ncbi:hypothetical protein HGP14_29320 [Rhizobium sp. P32RR-XVIII]|uniref:hypothetical protein n=1 Tax=Rhizobium sp. P32RR-XVIII TaxID=2726738 RepID=UPI0014570E15|nr:hypothetical protein [Rhizobium sp. P32RR-XVIII]NLS07381.1 hypothetical protein [Rhizobium sp. P32RR-XVIII]
MNLLRRSITSPVIEAIHLLPKRFGLTDSTPPPKLSVTYRSPAHLLPAPGFFIATND